MKRVTSVLSVLAAFLFPLILSCSDDNNVNPVYDLRTLSQVFEEFASTTESRSHRMIHKKPPGHMLIRSDQDTTPRVLSAFSQESTDTKETYTYEYGNNAHLYWTKATGKDALGNTVATAIQTLDDAGFPTRCMWYDGAGNFDDAYDYTYDKALYLMTSIIRYIDDPTDNSDAKRDYEHSNVWNQEGILSTRKRTEYDSSGIKFYEYKWRSVTQKNALRGAGGGGYYEYYKEYKDGQLKYQEKTEFNSEGYPQTFSIDNNGDGTYDETYHCDITKTDNGYLESAIMLEDGTSDKKSKEILVYDEEGLLKAWKEYKVSGGEFVLDKIYTLVWYKNPVNGPTGGLLVSFESDEDGKPLAEYQKIDWTEAHKIYHYYSSSEEEIARKTDSLEKIRLP